MDIVFIFIASFVVGVVAMVGICAIYLYYRHDGANDNVNDNVGLESGAVAAVDEERKEEEEEEKEQGDLVKAHLIFFEVHDDNAHDYGKKLMDDIMAITGLKDALYEKGFKIEDCNKMNVAKINFVIRQQSDEKAEDNSWVKKVQERLKKYEKVKKIKVMDIPYFLN